MEVKKWMSKDPEECDICHAPIVDLFIDGKTILTAWAIMCARCHDKYGVGIGTGKGQIYVRVEMEWCKVELIPVVKIGG